MVARILAGFSGKQDVLRYALTASSPETKDADFTWADFQTKNNSELVAILGNFVNRAFVLIDKNFEGIVPEKAEGTGLEEEVKRALADIPAKLETALAHYKFRMLWYLRWKLLELAINIWRMPSHGKL